LLTFEQLELTLRRVCNQQPRPDLFLKEASNALSFADLHAGPEEFLEEVLRHIAKSIDRPNDVIRLLFHQWLSDHDSRNLSDPHGWPQGTDPCSLERRNRIYDLLDINPAARQIVDRHFPIPNDANRGFGRADHVDWYDEARRQSTRYYAESLEGYLHAGGWTAQNISLVRQSAEYVIGNLADPHWAQDPSSSRVFAGRGLVVGYVQSGKTTMMNFTIATAIDVGYKLVIVLGGLTDLLRRQTQRRFDKEVAGKSVLQHDPEAHEASGYLFANDWPSFIEHGKPRAGVRPRNIERLTTFKNDYKRPIGNAFPPAWVNDPSSCRVVVIKKNKQRLQQLIRGIKQGIPADCRQKLSVLVLDDESDQATINTVDPRKSKERKGINQQLIELLSLLPNAQYVGVTATPAANCFTDPRDANDLYPRHFILPLARPDGYMGILDFHDLDSDLVPIPAELGQPKKNLHIRDIRSPRDEDETELRPALDSFVLSGALKLYRQSTGTYSAKQRHHTFFYSDSTFVEDMANAQKRILDIWNESAYSSKAGLARLQALYDNDLRGRSPHKDEIGHFPPTFLELIPYISKAVQKIDEPFDGHGPVLIVNGKKDSAQIDFQVMDIWKIVIGGMKLSRGYTIEGLTVTYFRRKSTNEAALMQMGRWFGYRAGYRDLVRLWISRQEAARPTPVDIYDFFESVCIDEETLRKKFREWYEYRNPDGSRITPIQIRPLISTVDSRLKPVAKNQMWNARLEAMTFSGVRENTVFGVGQQELEYNESLWRGLLKEFKLSKATVRGRDVYFSSDVPADRMVSVLEAVRRPSEPSSVQSESLFVSFLRSSECKVRRWTVVIPQLAESDENQGSWTLDGGLKLVEFTRGWKRPDVRLKTIGDKRDRPIAHVLTRTSPATGTPAELLAASREAFGAFASDDRGVVLLYPVRTEQQKGRPILAFECVVPDHSVRLGWVVVDSGKDTPLVSVSRPNNRSDHLSREGRRHEPKTSTAGRRSKSAAARRRSPAR
jgi:hypothetical protein